MNETRKENRRRCTALLLSFCMLFSLGDTAVYATGSSDEDAGLCEHHQVHTEACGYTEQTEEVPCGHVHDISCGYQEEAEETPCTHQHDETCGWQEDVEDSCIHVHDETCGYQPASEAVPCAHLHDEACGYQAAAEGTPCTYVCPVCSGMGSYALTESRDYTAYDNGTEDGKAVEGDGTTEDIPAATTKFTVTLPESTTFHYVNPDGMQGEEVDEATVAALALKVQQYTDKTVDADGEKFNYDAHKNKINEHMNWHTGMDDSTNDVQFWRIWFETVEGGREVEAVIPAGKKAAVEVEYLIDENDSNTYPNALQGSLGTRRICVMNMGNPGEEVPDTFAETDDYALEASSDPGELVVEDTHYTKITYYIDSDENGNSAWGNLTALCSMKLANSYVTLTDMTSVRDGLSALDKAEDDKDDERGNDSSDTNRRVRTFDSIEYMLKGTFATRSNTTTTDSVTAVLQAELPMDVTEARFDTGRLSTNYRLNDAPEWQIVYYNADGTAVYIEDPSGFWKCDSNGDKTDEETTLNAIANGSDNTNGNAYATEVVRQKLTAYKEIAFDGGGASGNDEFPVFLKIMAAKDGDTVEPSFVISVKGNKDNFTSEQDEKGNPVVSAMIDANRYEIHEAQGDIPAAHENEVVKVTAAPRYNVVIKQSSDTGYTGYFDFEKGTGADTKEDAGENSVKGRLAAYGITVQLFNETNWTNADGTVDRTKLGAKGMMGIELPVDSVTFDLQLSGEPGAGQEGYDPEDLALILWDWQKSIKENKVIENENKGEWERNLYWKESSVTRYAKGATVYNGDGSKTGQRDETYNGGNWSIEAKGDGVDNGKTTGSPSSNGSETRYTFTVKGFDFDLDNFTSSFPTYLTGSSAPADWLTEGYVGSFAAAHIQVVQLIPEEVDMDATIYAEALVADKVEYTGDEEDTAHFGATSLSGAKADKEAEASKNPDDKNEGIGGTQDDGKQVSLQIYAPGTMNKHNSFTDRNGRSIGQGFLGTSYWDNAHYDASVWAGSEIYLWGAAQLARQSEAVVSAYNLLQKFDSSKLEIDKRVEGNARLLYTDGNGDGAWPVENWSEVNQSAETMTTGTLKPEAGTATFFYAADPLYPNGWNADVKTEMDRMNSADEKDLIYYETLDALEDAGYTCIGILMEVRGAEIPAGCYPGMRVAMQVKTTVGNDESTVNEIACTVNTARFWVRKKIEKVDLMENVSWKSTIANNPDADEAGSLTKFTNKLLDDEENDLWVKYFGGENEDAGEVNKKLKEEYNEDGSPTTARYITCGKNDGKTTNGNYNNFPYVKTAYKDGAQVKGTHLGGYSAGMSLQILGYKASLNIGVTNEETNKDEVENSETFSPNKGQDTPLFTIDNITTQLSDSHGDIAEDSTTNLTVTAWVKKDSDPLEIIPGGYQVQSLVDGVLTWIEVSGNGENPTQVTVKDADSGKEYQYQVYAEISGDGELKFYLRDAPINKALAPLRFSALIGSDAANTDSYNVVAVISGDGDERAYSADKGNQAEATVIINKTGSTDLRKEVDHEYIEQNGAFAYTVSYKNNSDEPMKDKRIYLYDLLPYNGDNRNTKYERDDDLTKESDAFTVKSVSASLSGATGENIETKTYVYYSTIIPTALQEYLNFAKTGDTTYPNADAAQGEDLDQLLRNALIGNDGNGIWYVVKGSDNDHVPVEIYTYGADGKVKGVNTEAVEYEADELYGKVKVKTGYKFYNPRLAITADNLEKVNSSLETAENGKVKLQCYKMFRWLGVIDLTNGGGDLDTSGNNSGFLKYATCLYGVTTDMAANATLTVKANVQTADNEAANLYGNKAHAWVSGDKRVGGELPSNQVYTYVVGREISGLVWEDVDHDGTQNTVGGEAEPLIAGVTCTLFRWDETENKYVAVKGGDGPNNRLISVTYQEGTNDDGSPKVTTKDIEKDETVKLTTGADGSYCFSDLAEGDYVVAFSGNALKEYESETKYQVSGSNDLTGNDGVANGTDDVGKVLYPGISADDYAYCIKYGENASNVTMHDLAYLASNKNLLTNSVECVVHQDLGLIIDRYELPETGGSGGVLYRLAGILLILAAGWQMIRRRNSRGESLIYRKERI